MGANVWMIKQNRLNVFLFFFASEVSSWGLLIKQNRLSVFFCASEVSSWGLGVGVESVALLKNKHGGLGCKFSLAFYTAENRQLACR